MHSIFVGIDIGNTKTAYIAGDSKGRVIAVHLGPGASHQGKSEKETVKKLRNGIDGLGLNQSLSRIFIGAAGADSPAENEVLHRIYEQVFDGIPFDFDNDGLIALINGAEGLPGIVVTCGTGNTNFAVNRKGEIARIGGLSPTLGDILGARNIATLTMAAASRCEDGRDFPSLLPHLITQTFGVERVADLISRKMDNLTIKMAGDVLFKAAEAGDGKALEISWTLAREVLRITERFALTHLLPDQPFRLVLDGPVYHAGYETLMTMIRIGIQERFHADIIIPETPPVLGALYMAYEKGGIKLTPQLVDFVKLTYREMEKRS